MFFLEKCHLCGKRSWMRLSSGLCPACHVKVGKGNQGQAGCTAWPGMNEGVSVADWLGYGRDADHVLQVPPTLKTLVESFKQNKAQTNPSDGISSTTCGDMGKGCEPLRSVENSTRFSFPPRIGPSFEDGLRQQHAEGLEIKAVGENFLVLSWTDLLSRRREDFPIFTALNGRAIIQVLFSKNRFPSLEAVQQGLRSGLPVFFQSVAFLGGSYPILRCHILFPSEPIPDQPPGAIVLEAALDVADGDIQDFIAAVTKDEHVDLIIGHKVDLAKGTVITVSCETQGLAATLGNEVRRVLDKHRPHMNVQQFVESQQTMFSAFRDEMDGLERERFVTLRPVGKAKNDVITYERKGCI